MVWSTMRSWETEKQKPILHWGFQERITAPLFHLTGLFKRYGGGMGMSLWIWVASVGSQRVVTMSFVFLLCFLKWQSKTGWYFEGVWYVCSLVWQIRNSLDLSYVSIWERALRQCLERAGKTWNMIRQTFCLSQVLFEEAVRQLQESGFFFFFFIRDIFIICHTICTYHVSGWNVPVT